MDDRINIHEYLAMIRSRRRLIIFIILVGLVLGGFKTYRNYVSYVPKYTSVVCVKIDTMKVQKEKAAKEREKDSDKSSKDDEDKSSSDKETQGSSQVGSQNYQSGSFFNYSTIAQDEAIASRYYSYATDSAIYDKVAQVAGVRASKVELISAIQSEEKPEEIRITVKSSDPKSAQMIAAAIPQVYGDLLLKEIGIDCVATVYDASNGELIPRKIDKSVFMYGFGAIVIAIFIVLLLEVLNTKIITPDDVEKYWELPLLGVVPEFEDVPHKRGERRNASGSNGKNSINIDTNKKSVKNVNATNVDNTNTRNTDIRNINATNVKNRNVPHAEGSQVGSHTDKNNGK